MNDLRPIENRTVVARLPSGHHFFDRDRNRDQANYKLGYDMACCKSNSIPPAARYMRVIRQRTFTRWINVHLEIDDISIEDVADLLDSTITAKLLTVLSGRRIAVPIFEPQRKIRQRIGWRNVCKFLANQDFPAEVIGKNNFFFYLSLIHFIA